MDVMGKDERAWERTHKRQNQASSKGYSAHTDSKEVNSGNSCTKLAYYFCGGHYKLPECSTFQSQASEQLKFVCEGKLCQNCFSSTHYTSGCKNSNDCKSQTCRIQLSASTRNLYTQGLNGGYKCRTEAR